MLLFLSGPASAEWQIQPFGGLTFGGSTTFVDLENASGDANTVLGGRGVWLGNVFGLDADFGYAPGFFQSGNSHQVEKSGVTTLTGNVVVALPKRLAQYSLRPYFVGGAGLMHTRIDAALGAFQISKTAAVTDIGGGVTGFLTDRVGLNWDVRRFSSIRGKTEFNGDIFAPAQLSFWRASMALAFRY
jgi:hypothetical protein